MFRGHSQSLSSRQCCVSVGNSGLDLPAAQLPSVNLLHCRRPLGRHQRPPPPSCALIVVTTQGLEYVLVVVLDTGLDTGLGRLLFDLACSISFGQLLVELTIPGQTTHQLGTADLD